MPWNLLILPLVAGYYLLTKCYLFKFHQQRLDRQRLIFESILLGIAIMGVTYTIREFFIAYLPDFASLIYSYSPFDIPYALTSFFTIVVSISFSLIYNKFSTDKKWIKKSIKDVGNEFEILMKWSFTEKSLLQFTLDNGKVYVAYVKELPIPSISNYIRLIPIISGYRDNLQEVDYTTHYLAVYAEYIREGKVTNIKDLNTDIVLDITNIISVSNFDLGMHRMFQNSANSTTHNNVENRDNR